MDITPDSPPDPGAIGRWMTKRETADYLGVSLTRIVALVNEGHLIPIHRIGRFGGSQKGAMLFDPADILAYKHRRRIRNGRREAAS